MRRYFSLYRTLLSSALIRELEFRANFFAKVVQNLVWVGFGILILVVIYQNTQSVAGWTRGQAFLLAATCTFIGSVTYAFFVGLQDIPEMVRQGTLDFMIVRPADSMFLVSLRRFNFDQIGGVLSAIGMIVYGISQLGTLPSPVQILAYSVMLFSGIVIFYAFKLALMTTGIWFVKVDNLWVVSEMVDQISRYPIDIFGQAARRFFTNFVPLAFIATLPSEQLFRPVNFAIVGGSMVWAIAFLGFSRWFWLFAMRYYGSASS